jgi:hypothetical protein
MKFGRSNAVSPHSGNRKRYLRTRLYAADVRPPEDSRLLRLLSARKSMVRQGQKFQRPSKAVRRGLACGDHTWKAICRDLYDGMNKIQ